jgi:hypothetical protein
MPAQPFSYQAVMRGKSSQEVSSLIAYQSGAKTRFRAVIWSVPRRQWIFAPGITAGLLFDQDELRDETVPVNRATAEQMARDLLQTELPTETTLEDLCTAGETAGQQWRPPRS